MKVTKIVSIEPCRDGGTLVAQFKDKNDVHHVLELRVILGKGYKEPVLITYALCIYESTVTGIKHPKYETSEKNITWLEAKEILEEIKPLIIPGKNQRTDIFDSMVSIIKNKGKYIL